MVGLVPIGGNPSSFLGGYWGLCGAWLVGSGAEATALERW
jgi:hypothetical protein